MALASRGAKGFTLLGEAMASNNIDGAEGAIEEIMIAITNMTAMAGLMGED